MTHNTEPCGVCGKPLVKSDEYHCNGCENSKTNRCENEKCKSVFTYNRFYDEIALVFLLGKNREILDKWCSFCPKCRTAHKEFLPYWVYDHQLEHGTTKELMQLALEKNRTTKDELKHKGIPEELFS